MFAIHRGAVKGLMKPYNCTPEGLEERAQESSSLARLQSKRLYSIDEAARYLGRTAWAIRHLIWNGILPSVQIGRRVQLDIRDLDALIERGRRTER